METPDKIYNVAFISFAFKNTSIMKDLQKRGEFIKIESWEDEKNITIDIKQKLKENKNFRTPCSVFVTFAKESGYENTKNKKIEICGESVKIIPAPEPCDIIWENKEVTID